MLKRKKIFKLTITNTRLVKIKKSMGTEVQPTQSL